MTTHPVLSSPRIAILGGGPGGYEAAMVAASLGAVVTVIERAGLGGSAVLTDVVPSKTLIATADLMTRVGEAGGLGVRFDVDGGDCTPTMRADLKHINDRLLALAHQQSTDTQKGLENLGVRVLKGSGTLVDNHTIEVCGADGIEIVEADAILLTVGAHPRELSTARPDGERILNWAQLYNLEELPEELIVVGSGVTGAEFASDYNGLGSKVTLISSGDRVLPRSDTDAAEVLEGVFERRGVKVLARARAEAVERTGDGVAVVLDDGVKVTGSHCLVCVGSIPNTAGIGLEEAGVELTVGGHIKVDGVSRTTASNIYAAGDCTGVFALASVRGSHAWPHSDRPHHGRRRHPAEAPPSGLQHLHLSRDRNCGCLRRRRGIRQIPGRCCQAPP